MKSSAYFSQFLILLILTNGSLNSTAKMPDVHTVANYEDQYNYVMHAESHHAPSAIRGDIFDDFLFPENLCGSCPIVYWHCTQQYLVTDYTAPDDYVELTFGAHSGAPACSLCSGDCCRDFYIYKGTGITPTLFSSTLGVTDGTAVTLSSSSQDLYIIKVFNHGADPAADDPLLTGYVILIPKVKKMWIETSPICSGIRPGGTYYHFQVKTDPDISSFINVPTGLGSVVLVPFTPTTPPVCGELGSDAFPYPMTYNFSATDHMPGTVAIYDVLSEASTTPAHTNNIPLNNNFGIDASNYYIDFSQLNGNLSSAGADWGYSPTISVTFSDGVGSLPVTLTASATIPIESSAFPAATSIDPTATPPDGIAGPPNAIGVPEPSYDIYDYTVSGTESWSPTSNPMATMHGDGSTVGTIRIQHTLKVPVGAQLVLSGMTLEFGPGGSILVDAPAAVTDGGHLALSYSTLTAYRGCEVLGPGTDHSTWAGVSIMGNPTLPQYTGFIHSQGLLTMTHSTISYANVGVQNGMSATTGGGMIQMPIWAYNSFYNNIESIKLWDYVYAPAEIGINSSTFINNSSAWFVPYDMIGMTNIKGVAIDACTFTNNTGSNVQVGVIAADAGMTVENSTFNNFQSAIQEQSIYTPHAMAVTGNTFNNNRVGVSCYGSIAPSIILNTFNIPRYTGTVGSYYPGTVVSIVQDQSIGVLLNSTTGYNVAANIFQSNAVIGGSGSPDGYYPHTTGVLAYSTGSDYNQVTGNRFTGLGVALLSNFVNNNSTSGLQYLCNIDTRIGYDIAAVGYFIATGGINPVQGTSSYGSHTFDLPAGNQFSNHWNVYDQQQALEYNYQLPASTSNPQYPTLTFGPVISSGNPLGATCYSTLDPGPLTTTGVGGLASAPAGGVLIYRVATVNVNYYLNNSTGMAHRDSAYYWAAQMSSPYGDLLIANMLVEDSLIDSANTIYDGIIAKYSLTGPEANDFVQGRDLMDLSIAKRGGDHNPRTLTTDQVATLHSVKSTATMWAHARAEAWLNIYNGESFADTLLYPDGGDTTAVDTSHEGGRYGYHFSSQPITTGENMVYPNPVHDKLEVMYTATTRDAVMIQIEDVTGKMLLSQPVSSGRLNEVDMSGLVPGMYLYRITEGKNTAMVGKITKD